MIYIIMCLTDDCLGTCKNNFFKIWDETKLSTEINESHDMLIKLQREDDELFHLGCSLYENYSNLKLYSIQYKNICDLFKEWLNQRINEYRAKNKLCSKNELLDSTFKVLWEDKKNSQEDEKGNFCEWEPSTKYYCYVLSPLKSSFSTVFLSKIKKFVYDKIYRENIIRYYIQRLLPFRNRENFSFDFNTLHSVYTISMG
ncbi:variable surface protein [Plasmodium gonderi]|uniref:Variable surface protein n=1 Tax=Plasmodium gonderi TaxID=77519 RepID=A0A1Y1JSI3_PLAGO|nr:variable surface protein [Plasmodium gonderi]GAW84127.1 variable surface protein [Plasmodium gonderi]